MLKKINFVIIAILVCFLRGNDFEKELLIKSSVLQNGNNKELSVKHSSAFDDSSPLQNQLKILVMEGGAVRAIIQKIILHWLKLNTGKEPYQLFDLIVGSSAGAGVTIQLAASTPEGKIRHYIDELVANHINDAKAGFTNPSFLRNLQTGFGLWNTKYSAHCIFELSKKSVGECKLSETLVPIVIPVIDRATNKIRILSTRKAKESPETEDFYLRDLGTAALVFPALFNPWRMKSPIIREGQPENHLTASDAGPIIYNPGAIALKEAYEMQKQKILSNPLLTTEEKINKIKVIQKPKMLDVGSGIPKKWVESKTSDSTKEFRVPNSGILQNIKMIISQMFQGLGINAQDGVEAFFTGDDQQNNYTRLQVLLTKEEDGTYPFVLDDTRPEVINALINQTIIFTKTTEFLTGIRKIFGSELKATITHLKKEDFLLKTKPLRALL